VRLGNYFAGEMLGYWSGEEDLRNYLFSYLVMTHFVT
jgi:hypothetical protein